MPPFSFGCYFAIYHCQFAKEEERETVRRCEICTSYYQMKMRSVACSTVDSNPLEATYNNL